MLTRAMVVAVVCVTVALVAGELSPVVAACHNDWECRSGRNYCKTECVQTGTYQGTWYAANATPFRLCYVKAGAYCTTATVTCGTIERHCLYNPLTGICYDPCLPPVPWDTSTCTNYP